MQRPYILLAVVLLLGGCGRPIALPAPSPVVTSTVAVTYGSRTANVEVVSSPVALAQGLSGRSSLAPGSGMIFVFPDVAPRSFWMNDMLIPLDIIWLNSGRVVEIWADATPPTAGEQPARRAGPAADAVLELPAGATAASGLTIGDIVGLPPALDLRAAAR